jgi:hypothetical protein
MVAAPDLYAALEAIVTFDNEAHILGSDEQTARYKAKADNALAALKKARGEQ